MAARVKRPVEIGDVDIGELVGRCEVGLRFLVTLETLGRIGLCIGLVGFGIERRLPAGRARQRDVVAGILEHIIGRGKFLEPEPRPTRVKILMVLTSHDKLSDTGKKTALIHGRRVAPRGIQSAQFDLFNNY